MSTNISIQVTPQQLRSAATKINAQIEDYSTQYNQMFQNVDNMAAAWKGKDNTTFTTQIKATTESFLSMKQLLSEYSAHLERAAQSYENTQNEVASAAARLVY